MKWSKRTAGLALTVALAGCGPLPDPRPGYQGNGETLSEGSAFGVAVGMDGDEAHRILTADGRFKLKLRACLTPTGDYPDFAVPNGIQVQCHDGTQEIWRCDGLGPWEVLILNARDNRIIRIKWWRTRGYIG